MLSTVYISIRIFAIKSLSTKRIFIYHLMSLSTGSLHPQWPSPFPETQSNKNLASLRYNGSRLQLLLVTLSFIAILKRMSGIRFYFFSLPLQYRYFFLYIPSRIMQGRKPQNILLSSFIINQPLKYFFTAGKSFHYIFFYFMYIKEK